MDAKRKKSSRPNKHPFPEPTPAEAVALSECSEKHPGHELLVAVGFPPNPSAEPHIVYANWIDFRPECPFRPLDRRWQLAGCLADGESFPPEWIDEWVRRATQYRSTRDNRGEVNAEEMEAVRLAEELALNAPEMDRVEVDGRLLAGEPLATISEKVGLPMLAIEAYERLFYPVSKLLQSSGYITTVVIGVHSEKADQDIGVQLRLLAFTGGPIVLDAMLDAVRSVGDRSRVSEEVRKRRKMCLMNLKLRMTAVTDRNLMQLFRVVALQREMKIRR